MNNELLRHTISTIKYRFEKSVANSPENFSLFSLGKGSRSPVEIIHHMYQVLYFTRTFIEEEKFTPQNPEKIDFQKEVARFKKELLYIDLALNTKELPLNYSKRLLQGPISDLFTHIGQLSMLQRLNGNPIPKEDFSKAAIETGIRHEES